MTEPRPRVCGESDAWGAELALGLLSGPDRAAGLSHMAACPTCRERVDDLSRVADRLLLLAPDAEPPAGFESRVLAAVNAAAMGSAAGAAGAGGAAAGAAGGPGTAGIEAAGGAGVAGGVDSGQGGSVEAGPGTVDSRVRVGSGSVGGGDGVSGIGRRRVGPRGGRLVALVAALVAVAAVGGGVVATAVRGPSAREATVLWTGLAVSASGRTSCRVVVFGDRPASVLVSMDGYPGDEPEFMVEMETVGGTTLALGPMAVAGGHGLLVRSLDVDADSLRAMRMLTREGRVVYEATLTAAS